MDIRFNHVDFSYKKINCTSKEVFNDLNITFETGNIYGIVGKSGSGKTSLLELINCYILPTNGNINIGNFTITSDKNVNDIDALRFNIGYLFQNIDLQFFNKTIYEELSFNLIYYNYHTKDIEKRVKDSLKMVGLSEEYMYKQINTLSKGEKRLLSIASVLVHNPKVLLLDDPTIGLDGIGKDNLVRLIRLLKNRYHKTIIIADNDIDFLYSIVDNIHVIYNGKIVLSGNKYDVFKKTKLLKEYGIMLPNLIEFSNKVLDKKGIKLGYRDDINDLIKDIYRNVK